MNNVKQKNIVGWEACDIVGITKDPKIIPSKNDSGLLFFVQPDTIPYLTCKENEILSACRARMDFMDIPIVHGPAGMPIRQGKEGNPLIPAHGEYSHAYVPLSYFPDLYSEKEIRAAIDLHASAGVLQTRLLSDVLIIILEAVQRENPEDDKLNDKCKELIQWCENLLGSWRNLAKEPSVSLLLPICEKISQEVADGNDPDGISNDEEYETLSQVVRDYDNNFINKAKEAIYKSFFYEQIIDSCSNENSELFQYTEFLTPKNIAEKMLAEALISAIETSPFSNNGSLDTETFSTEQQSTAIDNLAEQIAKEIAKRTDKMPFYAKAFKSQDIADKSMTIAKILVHENICCMDTMASTDIEPIKKNKKTTAPC